MKAIQLSGVVVFAGGIITDNTLILLLGLLIQILSLLLQMLKERSNKKGSLEKEADSKPI